MIHIVAVVKKQETWVREGIELYEKRLKRPFDTEWLLLPHSVRSDLAARQDESERILARLGDDFVILLDEQGANISSPALSDHLKYPLDHSRSVTVIIGGAYGVDESVRVRADFVWSLSKLVFPHQLVRLLLVEQLYRAQEIAHGNPYHHN